VDASGATVRFWRSYFQAENSFGGSFSIGREFFAGTASLER
jgi:hypothetical protein